MTRSFVLDSFAIMALLLEDPGSDEVANLLHQAKRGETRVMMTWVNLGEVAYIVERRWGSARLRVVLATIEANAIEMVPAGRNLTLAASHIKARNAVAYADAFAAALALQTGATLVTGDPEFELLTDLVSVQWLPQRAE